MLFGERWDWPLGGWRSTFEEFDRIRREMDLLAHRLMGAPLLRGTAGVFPLMNITEDTDNFYVRAELPGIKAKDLEISVTGNALTLSGERKIPEAAQNVKYHRREREAGQFSRAVTLPAPIEGDKVEASFANGVLTIVLPKAEVAKPKQITVKTS